MPNVYTIFRKIVDTSRRLGLYRSTPLSDQPALRVRIERTLAEQPSSPVIDLSKARIVSIGNRRGGNWLVLCGRRGLLRTKISVFPGAADNIVLIGSSAKLPQEIRFEQSGNIAIIGDEVAWCAVTMRFIARNAVISLGRRSIYMGTSFIVEGDQCGVFVGDECLFATGTTVRSSDLHGMYDICTGEWLNPPKSVVIEPHVWLGQDTIVLKGTRIGGGSVIGARSIVNRDMPRFSLCAGTPAKPIRTGISWSLEREAKPEQYPHIAAIVEKLDPS